MHCNYSEFCNTPCTLVTRYITIPCVLGDLAELSDGARLNIFILSGLIDSYQYSRLPQLEALGHPSIVSHAPHRPIHPSRVRKGHISKAVDELGAPCPFSA